MPGPEREPLSIITHGRTSEFPLDARRFSVSALMNIVRLQIEQVYPNPRPRFIKIESPNHSVTISHPELKQLYDIFKRGNQTTRSKFFNMLDGVLSKADRVVIGEILP